MGKSKHCTGTLPPPQSAQVLCVYACRYVSVCLLRSDIRFCGPPFRTIDLANSTCPSAVAVCSKADSHCQKWVVRLSGVSRGRMVAGQRIGSKLGIVWKSKSVVPGRVSGHCCLILVFKTSDQIDLSSLRTCYWRFRLPRKFKVARPRATMSF